MIGYRILPEHKLIVICVWGTAGVEEIDRMSERLRKDPAFSEDYDAIVDNTKVAHSPSGEDIRKLSEPRMEAIRAGAKLAVVAPSDSTYGTSRMHQLLTEPRYPLQIEIFRERNSALEWLGRKDVALDVICEDVIAEGAAWQHRVRPGS